MNTTYFKQMPIHSAEFNAERIEIFSYDRIANAVIDTIIEQLVNVHEWDHAAAVEFVKSKAMRYGLDQTLEELLNAATATWVNKEAPEWKANCHEWAKEAEQTT
jgi:hypothetical protein